MKRAVAVVIVLLLFPVSAFCGTVFVRGSGGVGSGRVYLVNLDYESTVSWDAISGTNDCNLDNAGDYCGQYSGQKHAGSYSAGVRGDSSYYMAKSFSAKGELYADWWQYNDTGRGNTYLILYDSSNANYTVSVYYNGTSILIYNNEDPSDTYKNTGFSPSPNTWTHYRLYWKRDTDDTDGVIKFWHSTTETDFDGVTPNNSWTDVNTANSDSGYMRLRGPHNLYKIYYDDTKIWEPDGNE